MIRINVKPFPPSLYIRMACNKSSPTHWSEHPHRASMMGKFRSPRVKRENVSVQIESHPRKEQTLAQSLSFFSFPDEFFNKMHCLPKSNIWRAARTETVHMSRESNHLPQEQQQAVDTTWEPAWPLGPNPTSYWAPRPVGGAHVCPVTGRQICD